MIDPCQHKFEKDGPARAGGRHQPMKCSLCGERGTIVKPAPTPKCAETTCAGPAIYLCADEKGRCDKHVHLGGGMAR